MKTFKKLVILLCAYRFSCVMLFVYALTIPTCGIFLALQIKNIVSAIFIKHQSFSYVQFSLVLIISIILVRSSVVFFIELTILKTASKIRINLRKKYLESILFSPFIGAHNQSLGSNVALFTEATDAIEPWYAIFLPQALLTAVCIPSFLVVAFIFDPFSAYIMLVTIPFIPLLLALIGRGTSQLQKNRFVALSKLGGYFLESLKGIKFIKRVNSQQNTLDTLFSKNESFRIKTLEILRVAFLSAFVVELATTISIALIAVSLGFRLMKGNIAFENAFLILLIAPELYFPIRLLAQKYHSAQAGITAAQKLSFLFDSPQALKNAKHNNHSLLNPKTPYGIVVNEVRARYKNAKTPSIQNISFTIPKSGVIAIVGKSGSGKSTLLNTLAGFLPCEEGTIFHNEKDCDLLTKEERLSLFGYVSQQPFLFAGTIAENIQLGKPNATRNEIENALISAGGTNLLSDLTHGLSTHIGINNYGVSRGEATRITLARALLKGSHYLLLDEPTAALDSTDESLILQTVKDLATSHGILLVAHRHATMCLAEKIYIMNNGSLVESGTYQELFSQRGTFHSLVTTWDDYETTS